MRHALSLGLLAAILLVLAGCAGHVQRAPTRWDAYYAHAARPRPHVFVMPPEGVSVPMAKLIARYVVKYLNKHAMVAEVGRDSAVAPIKGAFKKGINVFVLSGMIEQNTSDPRIRYPRVLHWMVSDANGRVITTYTQGIDGTRREWDFGSARLLNAIGFDAAGPIAQIIRAESQGATPTIPSDTPLRRGVLLERISGVSKKDAKILMAALKKALRATDVLVTGDERQAGFRLLGAVEMHPVRSSAVHVRAVHVRIVWTVTTLDRMVVGRAVQENTVRAQELKNGWSRLAPRVGEDAAVGVERILGVRSDPFPERQYHTGAAPPVIVLPSVFGRAPPPPH